jgi:hypothetical protein
MAVSDLRARPPGRRAPPGLRFHSQNYLNRTERETVDGQAEQADGSVNIRLSKPGKRTSGFDRRGVSDRARPPHHRCRARGQIVIADCGLRRLDNGQKLYDTLTVIGKPIAPDQAKPADAVAGREGVRQARPLAGDDQLFRSRRRRGPASRFGLCHHLELYENGVSRALMLDYGNFVLSGEMTSIEMKAAKPCP